MGAIAVEDLKLKGWGDEEKNGKHIIHDDFWTFF